MKKLLPFLGLILLFVSCQKDDNSTPDYTNKYTYIYNTYYRNNIRKIQIKHDNGDLNLFFFNFPPFQVPEFKKTSIFYKDKKIDIPNKEISKTGLDFSIAKLPLPSSLTDDLYKHPIDSIIFYGIYNEFDPKEKEVILPFAKCYPHKELIHEKRDFQTSYSQLIDGNPFPCIIKGVAKTNTITIELPNHFDSQKIRLCFETCQGKEIYLRGTCNQGILTIKTSSDQEYMDFQNGYAWELAARSKDFGGEKLYDLGIGSFTWK